MKIKSILLSLFLVVVATANGQEKEFKPSGSPYAKLFLNFHTNLTDDGIEPAFEAKRAYFGYKYSLSEEFSANVLLDVGEAEVNIGDSLSGTTTPAYSAFLKGASITYNYGKLTIDGGMIGLHQFKLYEKYWGHRYISKSYQDQYKFGPSADLGLFAQYKAHDVISFDITLRNGDGYKNLQLNNSLLAALGWTLTPIDGLAIRGFYDYYNVDTAQVTISHFAGYMNDLFTIGAEYTMQLNHKHEDGNDINGLSVVASINATDKIEIFARTDVFNPDSGDSTNGFIGGIQYSPIKKIQLALNYQGEFEGNNNSNAIFLNAQVSF